MKFELAKVGDFDVFKGEASSLTELRAIVSQANASAVGGFTDWVAPDTQTLRALALLAPDDIYVLSASPYVGGSNLAWGVYFGNGSVRSYGRDYSSQVRLVRASQCLALGTAGQLKSMEEAGLVVQKVDGGAA